MHMFKLRWLTPLVFIAACGSQEQGPTTSLGPESKTRRSASETYAVHGVKVTDSAKKFIRTADIECEAPDVPVAVTTLEHAVIAVGGAIQESTTTSICDHSETVYYSRDSLKRVDVRHSEAMLTLRVPAMYLDSIVAIIPGLATTVNRRRLMQEDVTFRYLSNEMLNGGQTALPGPAARGAGLDRGYDVSKQRYADERKEKLVARYIENLQLANDVARSTLTIKLSQPVEVHACIIPDLQYAVRVPFRKRCANAFSNGLTMVAGIFAALLAVWPVWLVLGGVACIVFAVRKRAAGRLRKALTSMQKQ